VIIRLIMSYLTFPGVVVHEFAHAWACRRMGIPVLKICYLRIGNPLGYVLHERPEYAIQHIMIAVAPFFVSTFCALAVSLVVSALYASYFLPEFHTILIPSALWLSFSIALHAFPSSGDADALWDEVKNGEAGFLAKLLLVPVVALIRLTGFGARVWLDTLYAMVVVAVPPLVVLACMT
jgi:hypothetical protein